MPTFYMSSILSHAKDSWDVWQVDAKMILAPFSYCHGDPQLSWNLKRDYDILKATWILVIKKTGKNTLATFVPTWANKDNKWCLEERNMTCALLGGASLHSNLKSLL